MSRWPRVALGEVLRHRKEFIQIDNLAQYKRPRAQLHAQGVVLRDEDRGRSHQDEGTAGVPRKRASRCRNRRKSRRLRPRPGRARRRQVLAVTIFSSPLMPTSSTPGTSGGT